MAVVVACRFCHIDAKQFQDVEMSSFLEIQMVDGQIYSGIRVKRSRSRGHLVINSFIEQPTLIQAVIS
ncbi:hypothetical protein KR100_01555 [Synechococcus sp. KORDI-100]|nr:hypothetical protein KR100_01555 [Synechococcus sp. KORDI-100]